MNRGGTGLRGDDIAAQLHEALGFLSHDAREGHSSTLALLELYRVRAGAMPASELVQRLERHVRRSLARIDDFVAYAQARSQALQIETVDLHELLRDALAAARHAGSERGLTLQLTAPRAAPVAADRSLLREAIARLLQHALDRGRHGSELVCTLRELPRAWSIEVDEVSSTNPVSHGDATAATGAPGCVPAHAANGPGWALVALVAGRLGGTAQEQEQNEPAEGVNLRMTLPRA